MCEVCGKLKTALDVVRLFLYQLTALDFQSGGDQILLCACDEFAPLVRHQVELIKRSRDKFCNSPQ